MLKIAGIIIVCCSIATLGVFKGDKILERRKIRKELIRMLENIETSILYSGRSIEQILSNFSSEILSKHSFLGKDYRPDTTVLSDDERKITEEFFSEAGKSYSRERELRLCRQYIEKLSQLDKRLSKDEETKANLYKKLSLIGAVLIAIILI